jgi:hypothetical protein
VVCEESRHKKIFSTTPWTNRASNVRFNIVAGTHFGCITKNVSELARSLDDFFRTVDVAQEKAP